MKQNMCIDVGGNVMCINLLESFIQVPDHNHPNQRDFSVFTVPDFHQCFKRTPQPDFIPFSLLRVYSMWTVYSR